jgi:hypothetical protein
MMMMMMMLSGSNGLRQLDKTMGEWTTPDAILNSPKAENSCLLIAIPSDGPVVGSAGCTT